MNSPPKVTAPGLEDLPPGFKFCDLDASSNTGSNPYHAATSSLAQSLNSDSMFSIIMNFWSFVSNMRPEYKRLLERKDPRALLLLAY